MDWFMDLFIIFIIGLASIAASVICGFYWLKHERFPWEKKLPEEQSQSQQKESVL